MPTIFPLLSILFASCSAFSAPGALSKIKAGSSTTRSRLHFNVAVFGGSGKTGSECVYQSLQQGYRPFVLARDSSKMKVPLGSGGSSGGTSLYDPNLSVCTHARYYLLFISDVAFSLPLSLLLSQVIKGDVTDQSAVDKVFENNNIDGVIISLGGRTSSVGPTMLTDGTNNIIKSMKKFNVKRVSIVTSIGTGDSLKQAPLSFRMLIYTVMRKLFRDKNNQEQLFLSPSGPGNDLEYVTVL